MDLSTLPYLCGWPKHPTDGEDSPGPSHQQAIHHALTANRKAVEKPVHFQVQSSHLADTSFPISV
jgi:hypothetical protein